MLTPFIIAFAIALVAAFLVSHTRFLTILTTILSTLFLSYLAIIVLLLLVWLVVLLRYGLGVLNFGEDDDEDNRVPTVPVPIPITIREGEQNYFGQGSMPQDIADFLTCLVCKELLFLPVVLHCGHALCHKCCLDYLLANKKCPLCMTICNYFPRTCFFLYFLGLRMYPDVYKERLAYIEEVEKITKQLYPRVDHTLNPQFNHLMNGESDFTEDEFRCTACDSFLYLPVTLHCGHVLCKDCVLIKDNGEHKCPLCKREHRESKLMETFYLKDFFDSKLPNSRKAPPIGQASTSDTPQPVDSETGPGGFLCHICGKYPIRGQIYECIECEQFYVCGRCESEPYDGHPGFNRQRHSGKHHLRLR